LGKKRSRSGRTSKGERQSVGSFGNPKLSNAEYHINLRDMWKQGKNPWILTSTQNTNTPFIKVKANDLWGSPKTSVHNIFGKMS